MDFYCTKCQTTHSEDEWNKTTRKDYGEDIVEIVKAWEDGELGLLAFTCPNCFDDYLEPTLVED